MNPSQPLVSVIVTTYNQAAYIGETLASVFAQTHEPAEVIVVDDGSTDDTAQQVNRFKGRVHYIYQENQGVAGSRNTGIRAAHGELLAFLDGDDLWEKEKLAVQVAAAQKHPDSGLIAVDGVKFGHSGILSGSIFGIAIRPYLAASSESIVSDLLYLKLCKGNFISTTSQVMVSARVLNSIGLSDPKFRICSDYDLYLRISSKYKITLVKEALTRWRYLETSVSGPDELRYLNWSKENVAVLKKHFPVSSEQAQPVISLSIRNTIFSAAQGAFNYGRRTDRIWATRYLLSLLSTNPRELCIVAFVVALWCPEFVNRMLGPAIRRIVSSGSNN